MPAGYESSRKLLASAQCLQKSPKSLRKELQDPQLMYGESGYAEANIAPLRSTHSPKRKASGPPSGRDCWPCPCHPPQPGRCHSAHRYLSLEQLGQPGHSICSSCTFASSNAFSSATSLPMARREDVAACCSISRRFWAMASCKAACSRIIWSSFMLRSAICRSCNAGPQLHLERRPDPRSSASSHPRSSSRIAPSARTSKNESADKERHYIILRLYGIMYKLYFNYII